MMLHQPCFELGGNYKQLHSELMEGEFEQDTYRNQDKEIDPTIDYTEQGTSTYDR